MILRTLLMGGILVACSAGLASAQVPDQARSNTAGLNIGVSFNGSALRVEDSDLESGGGVGFRVGYGITPSVTLFLAGDGSLMADNEYVLGHGDVGVRFNFGGQTQNLIPYVDVALSSRVMSDDDYEISGFGGSVGGGLQVFVSQPLALDLGLLWTYGQFNTFKDKAAGISVSGDGVSAMSTRLNLGISWYPMTRR